MVFEMMGQRVEGQDVALRAEAANEPQGGRGDERMLAEFLSLEEVRQVNLDGGERRCFQRVQDGDGGMCICAPVEDQTARLGSSFLNPVDQRAFHVGLTKVDGKTKCLGMGARERIDIGERFQVKHICVKPVRGFREG